MLPRGYRGSTPATEKLRKKKPKNLSFLLQSCIYGTGSEAETCNCNCNCKIHL